VDKIYILINQNTNYYPRLVPCLRTNVEETARILEKIRLRELESPGVGRTATTKIPSRNGKGRPQDKDEDEDDEDDDVDHALGASLKALRGSAPGSNQPHERKGQVITIEWDERMETMKKGKAEAEARAGQ
jgi:hypothetical protein